ETAERYRTFTRAQQHKSEACSRSGPVDRVAQKAARPIEIGCARAEREVEIRVLSGDELSVPERGEVAEQRAWRGTAFRADHQYVERTARHCATVVPVCDVPYGGRRVAGARIGKRSVLLT